MPSPALTTPAGAATAPDAAPALPALPSHAPVAALVRGGAVEGVHYGSIAVTDAEGSLVLGVGAPTAPFYPRSALKPLQAVALVRAGLRVREALLALAAASHSGAAAHRDGAREILALHGLGPDALRNTLDLPYGAAEREDWLRHGGTADQLCQNCSGKHAAMAAVCALNGWDADGYLDPGHPLQLLVAETVAELTGETPALWTTDGCGTPLPALTLAGMARAYGRLAAAGARAGSAHDSDAAHPGAEAAVARAMARHPEMVAGEDRDVTALMRALPGSVAKDGFEGVQLVGLADGRAVGVKVSDGGDRARMPVTVRALAALGVPEAAPDGPLAALAAPSVLGGGRRVGALVALEPAAPASSA